MKEYRRIGPDYRKSILVVGADDVLETKFLHYIQQETPYDVQRVFTGTQARQFARANQIDLLILSYYLPDMSGPALYDEIDRIRGRQNMPTILLNKNLVGEDLHGRNIICLTQPLDKDLLLQTLDTLFLFPRCPVEAI
jgi:DNA-binding response OmpR family regulator